MALTDMPDFMCHHAQKLKHAIRLFDQPRMHIDRMRAGDKGVVVVIQDEADLDGATGIAGSRLQGRHKTFQRSFNFGVPDHARHCDCRAKRDCRTQQRRQKHGKRLAQCVEGLWLLIMCHGFFRVQDGIKKNNGVVVALKVVFW